MFKSIIAILVVAALIFGAAESSQAGYYGKWVEFVNDTPYKLYAYYIVDNYYDDVWYCDYLTFGGVVYPGESINFYVNDGLYGCFTFKTWFSKCDSDFTWETKWIDARWNLRDQIIYIY